MTGPSKGSRPPASPRPKAMAEAQQEALSESVATQLATKSDLAELKLDVIKWMVGLVLAQVSLLAGILVKLL
jgi:hypothetical protein